MAFNLARVEMSVAIFTKKSLSEAECSS